MKNKQNKKNNEAKLLHSLDSYISFTKLLSAIKI